MQLIVLGMHRSGTSVLARLLNLMGAYFGPEGAGTGANPENPKGFWERRDVRNLNDHVLQSVGCDWNRVLGFDPRALPEALAAEFARRASRLVLEMDAHRPWLLKEPRLCLLLPLWREVLDAPACIHIHRHPVEVAASLRARNGIPIEAGLALWERYVRDALAASSGLPAVMVSHRQLMQQPGEAVRQLLTRLEAIGETGLRMPSEAEVAAFVEGGLYRQRECREDLLAYRDAPQVRLFEHLTSSELPSSGILGAMDATSELALAEYEARLPPLAPKSGPSLPSSTRSHHAASDYARLARALNRAENAAVDAERRLAERFCETAALTRMLLEKDAGIVRLRTRQRALAKARNAAHATIEETGRRLVAANRLLDRTRARSDDQAERIRTLEALLLSTGARAARAERRLGRVTASLTWRMTAPLRAAWRWIRQRGHAGDARRDEVDAIRASDLFDARWYLERNPDVSQHGIDAALHYLDHGALERRDPGPAFDTAFYVASNPDVAAAGENPLLHFIRHGCHEGRQPRGASAARPDGR
jgi:hypothetical protein